MLACIRVVVACAATNHLAEGDNVEFDGPEDEIVTELVDRNLRASSHSLL